jgi:hypothetical protein
MSHRSRFLASAVVVTAILLLGASCKEDKKLKVTSLDPKRGDFQGGTLVTFKGNRFTKDGARRATVYFGSSGSWKKAEFLGFKGDDEFRVRAPGGEPKKKVDVMIVFEPGGEITLANAFEYVEIEIPDVGDLDISKPKR